MEENKKPETTSQQDSAPADYSRYMGTLNLDTPRERELNAQIKKQHQKIQIFKNKLSNLIDELDTSASV